MTIHVIFKFSSGKKKSYTKSFKTFEECQQSMKWLVFLVANDPEITTTKYIGSYITE